mgnify:CR=1 FL=1
MLDFGFYNMDCMEGMKQFPDKYFDLAIVDPPYGDANGQFVGKTRFGERFARYNKEKSKIHHGCGHWHYSDVTWDVAPGDDYFKELFRISRNQIIWGGELFSITTYQGFSDMAQNKCTAAIQYGHGRVRMDVISTERKSI